MGDAVNFVNVDYSNVIEVDSITIGDCLDWNERNGTCFEINDGKIGGILKRKEDKC